MNDRTIELLRGLRPADAEEVNELFPAQRRLELLTGIVGGAGNLNETGIVGEAPVSGRTYRSSAGRRSRTAGGTGRAWAPRRLRPGAVPGVVLTALGGALVAVVAVVVLVGGSAVGPAPADAVAFRTVAGGEIVARVIEPYAAQARLDAAFAHYGLKIKLRLVPVSPSLVGTVSYASGEGIAALQGGHCLTGGGGCPVGIEIPRDFAGQGEVVLGRPAKPGERYEGSASAFAPGEPLHCSGLLGARVAGALGGLRSRGLVVGEWREIVPSASGRSARSLQPAVAPARNYIWGAELTARGQLRVTTESAPWPGDPGAGSHYNDGC